MNENVCKVLVQNYKFSMHFPICVCFVLFVRDVEIGKGIYLFVININSNTYTLYVTQTHTSLAVAYVSCSCVVLNIKARCAIRTISTKSLR